LQITLISPKIPRLVIALVWVFSAVATGLATFGIAPGHRKQCNFYKFFTRPFLLVAVVMGVFLPFVILIALNIRILVKVSQGHYVKVVKGHYGFHLFLVEAMFQIHVIL
jgi:hypothetical protein